MTEQMDSTKADEVRRLFEGMAFSLADNELRESVMDGVSYIISACWLAAAAEMGRMVVTEIEQLRNLWGEGDREKAFSVMAVCVLPIMSHWFRTREKYDRELAEMLKDRPELIKEPVGPEEERKSVEGMVDFLGRGGEDAVKLAVNMDLQHREAHPEEGEGKPWWYTILLLSKLLEALGGQGFVDWDKTSFPVREETDIHWIPEVDWPNFLADAVTVSRAEEAGIKAFYDTRNEFRGA